MRADAYQKEFCAFDYKVAVPSLWDCSFVRTGSATASARYGKSSASPLPSHRQIKGHNCSPVDHRDGVIPNIADAHLALRLHLLQIFPSFDRSFFQVPIRAALAIYLDLETSTEVLLKHTRFSTTRGDPLHFPLSYRVPSVTPSAGAF
jgi:hypothetical protein